MEEDRFPTGLSNSKVEGFEKYKGPDRDRIDFGVVGKGKGRDVGGAVVDDRVSSPIAIPRDTVRERDSALGNSIPSSVLPSPFVDQDDGVGAEGAVSGVDVEVVDAGAEADETEVDDEGFEDEIRDINAMFRKLGDENGLPEVAIQTQEKSGEVVAEAPTSD